MSAPPSSDELAPLDQPSDDRLDSWKEIATYLRRDVTTVQRWEKREAMPVHRHVHDKKGSVYAFRTELDAWARSRNLPLAQEDIATELLDGVILRQPYSTPTLLLRRLECTAEHAWCGRWQRGD